MATHSELNSWYSCTEYSDSFQLILIKKIKKSPKFLLKLYYYFLIISTYLRSTQYFSTILHTASYSLLTLLTLQSSLSSSLLCINIETKKCKNGFEKMFNRLQISKNDQTGKSSHTLFCRMVSSEPPFLFHFQMPNKVFYTKRENNH